MKTTFQYLIYLQPQFVKITMPESPTTSNKRDVKLFKKPKRISEIFLILHSNIHNYGACS